MACSDRRIASSSGSSFIAFEGPATGRLMPSDPVAGPHPLREVILPALGDFVSWKR